MAGGETSAATDEAVLLASERAMEFEPTQPLQRFARKETTPEIRPPRVKRLFRKVLPARPATVADLWELEFERGLGFLLVPVHLAAGAIFYFGMTGEPNAVPMLLLTLVACGAVFATRNHRLLHLASLSLFLVLAGACLAKLETWRLDTKMLGSTISTLLEGRVAALEETAEGRFRLTLDVLSTSRPTLRYAPERVRVTARQIPDALKTGDVVSGIARLMPPSGPVRPGSYDFSFQSYFDGIGASGFFLGAVERTASQPAKPPTAVEAIGLWLGSAREAIAKHIHDRIGGPEGAVAAALMVGTRGGIPEEINEAMRRTGIYHVISISGLHMALVAGTVMGLMRACLALFPAWASRHNTKKNAAAVALLATTAYLSISGGEVAAQRSYIMLAVMLIAVLCDRAALTMRNLAISAIVVLVLSPHEVMGPSFQMSFAATAALVGAYAFWSERNRKHEQRQTVRQSGVAGWLWRRGLVVFGALAATSLIAGLATAVYGIWHFQRVAPLSLLANLAIMPIVSVIVMPFAVGAALAMPFGLDGPFLAVMGYALTAVIAMSHWFSERSPIDAVGIIPVWSALLMTVALVAATMLSTRLRVLALPFAIGGVAAMPLAMQPLALISEDARLVAIPAEDKNGNEAIAVNRPRAGSFTVDNWKYAFGTDTVLRPTSATASLHGNVLASLDENVPEGFACAGEVCAARSGTWQVIHAATGDAAKAYCGEVAILIVDDATFRGCPSGETMVVTKRDLARLGSAAIYSPLFGQSSSSASPLTIDHAIEQPYRSWHAQRLYSREARGLPPYVRPEQREGPTEDSKASGDVSPQ
ncbi:ComEC/Rec2 family competence protein [Corticibacterium sp. UT-5YL-CI-8]|nr:ComEC/Rec2 family competence protein [Tianweitania sp. UT-5YL-CI-8]